MRGFLHLFMAVIAGGGVGWISAVSMIENYGLTAVPDQPFWSERRNTTGDAATPYALGYFINQGQVPPPSSSRHYIRSSDDGGNPLRNDCIYQLSGAIPKARHWTLSVAANNSTFASLSSSDVIFEPDGKITVVLSVQPEGGNWLTLPGRGTPSLSLTLHDVLSPPDDGTLKLPSIKRLGC